MLGKATQLRSSRSVFLVGTVMVLMIVGSLVLAGDGLVARAKAQGQLVVHEWGTFTSVIDQSGQTLVWRPLSLPTDLPGFVYGIVPQSKRQDARNDPQYKINLSAKIRMETPVVYFYSDEESTASLKVDFPQGVVTEWYPQGDKGGNGIGWEAFKILPGPGASFPVEQSTSRYYSARATDSASIRVAGSNGQEDEKFLFYRGIGNFDLPLLVKLRQGGVNVKTSAPASVPEAILFQNLSGKSGYQVKTLDGDRAAFSSDQAVQPVASIRTELARMLVQSGLYEKEAQAMLDTWGDTWFEPGERVFYVLPRDTTDAILPMTINPMPTALERVMVCRVEIITPEMEQAVKARVAGLSGDRTQMREVAAGMIREHGRFLETMLERLSQRAADDPVTKARIDRISQIARELAWEPRT